MRRIATLFLLPLGLAASCGKETTPETTDTTPTVDDQNVFPVALPEIDVPTGDSFECVYTGVYSDEDMSVHAISGTQEAGGHHITTYFTDQTKTGHAPCTDEEMADWHMVGGADTQTTGEPVIKLPEGIAYRVPKGKQIVAQIHYINTTGKAFKAQDTVQFELMDPVDVEAYANLFTIVDGSFQIPPNAETTSVSVATLDQDVPMFSFGGHMHEFGKHFKLETLDDAGNTIDVIYDEDWLPEYASHPPTNVYSKDAPFLLKKGTKIRQTCTWDNTSADMVGFPREMCVMFGFYFPDKGTGEIIQIATPQN